MKTLIKSLAQKTLILTALVSMAISTTSMATIKEPTKKVYEIKNVKKIMVSGNVEVILVQSNNEAIRYQDDNLGKANVSLDGQTLKIKSDNNTVAKLVVTVKDIYRIDLSGNAKISTENILNTQFLQIYLRDDSRANISSNTEGLYTVLKDNAELSIDGGTQNHITAINSLTKINAKRLVATHTTIENESFVAKLK
jgi:hypothetical protein